MEFEATTPCRLASRSLLIWRRCFKLAVGRTLPLHLSIWSIWSNWSTAYLTLCCFHMWCASAIRDALSISSSQLSSNQNTRIAGTKCPAMDLLQKMGVFLSCFCDALTCVLRWQTLNVFEVRGVSNLGWFGTLGPARTDYLGVPWAFFLAFLFPPAKVTFLLNFGSNSKEHHRNPFCLHKDQWLADVFCRSWHYWWSHLSATQHPSAWMACCNSEVGERIHWKIWQKRSAGRSLCFISSWWSSLGKDSLQSLAITINFNKLCTLGYSNSGPDMVWIHRWYFISWHWTRFLALGVLRVAKFIGDEVSLVRPFGQSLLSWTWLELFEFLHWALEV